MTAEIFFAILLIGVIGLLPIHWISLIPGDGLGGGVGEMIRLLVGAFRLTLAYFAGFYAGANLDVLQKNRTYQQYKSYAGVVATIFFVVALVYYSYGSMWFRGKARDILANEGISDLSTQNLLIDSFLESETGFSGYWGYFIFSTRSDAYLDMFGETLYIPQSGFATGLNWILRILILGATWYVARQATLAGVLEKFKSIQEGRKVSYDSVFEYMMKILEQD